MDWAPWILIAVVVAWGGWFSHAVVSSLRQIEADVRQIRTQLRDVSGEFEKVSGLLDYVQRIPGLGGSPGRRGHER
jgi:hypothetical protein